jgi:hypothetical protein
MDGIFTLNWESFKSAAVSVVLMAILSIMTYIIGLGDIFAVDWKALINIGIISLATGIVSLIKNFFTSTSGKFAGTFKIE